MRRGLANLTLLPFALVAVLAVGLAIAGRVSTPDIRTDAAVGKPPATLDLTSTPARSSGGPRSQPPVAAAPSATAPAPPSGSNDAAEMLRVHNQLRVAVGAPAVRSDERVTAAAQRHAEYLARNDALGHEEAAGEPGFTGVSVRDRLAVQGYADATASEVATSFSSGTDGVRSLWVLPYHRLGLMHPHAVLAGWGHFEIGGRSTTVGVIVYDFGAIVPDVVRSPAPDQRVAPSWDGDEFPDVLPAGAARPVGYPIMLIYGRAQPVELRAARMTDAGGREVAYYVVSQIYERDYVAIVPAAPLAAGARYRVRLELRVAGADVTEEWEFATDG